MSSCHGVDMCGRLWVAQLKEVERRDNKKKLRRESTVGQLRHGQVLARAVCTEPKTSGFHWPRWRLLRWLGSC